MPVVTACTSCGKKFKVGDAAVGKKARCKACGEVFVVAAAPGGGSAPKAEAARKPKPKPKPAPAPSGGLDAFASDDDNSYEINDDTADNGALGALLASAPQADAAPPPPQQGGLPPMPQQGGLPPMPQQAAMPAAPMPGPVDTRMHGGGMDYGGHDESDNAGVGTGYGVMDILLLIYLWGFLGLGALCMLVGLFVRPVVDGVFVLTFLAVPGMFVAGIWQTVVMFKSGFAEVLKCTFIPFYFWGWYSEHWDELAIPRVLGLYVPFPLIIMCIIAGAIGGASAS